ncbi:helix-turn-helix domain-containing protein [Lentzea flaviverrucosa]|uniref:helix-turn-helix domain-containing protein n=1 Tax=Lentzea flaviverrucosa TaxID=200379 RepID=UPI001FE3BE73|nr:helix-turn-helix domain-containing protein [Lentzea flaviverrucosa]
MCSVTFPCAASTISSHAPGATIAQASAELGIGRATIYRKMAQYGIKADQLQGWSQRSRSSASSAAGRRCEPSA